MAALGAGIRRDDEHEPPSRRTELRRDTPAPECELATPLTAEDRALRPNVVAERSATPHAERLLRLVFVFGSCAHGTRPAASFAVLVIAVTPLSTTVGVTTALPVCPLPTCP